MQKQWSFLQKTLQTIIELLGQRLTDTQQQAFSLLIAKRKQGQLKVQEVRNFRLNIYYKYLTCKITSQEVQPIFSQSDQNYFKLYEEEINNKNSQKQPQLQVQVQVQPQLLSKLPGRPKKERSRIFNKKSSCNKIVRHNLHVKGDQVHLNQFLQRNKHIQRRRTSLNPSRQRKLKKCLSSTTKIQPLTGYVQQTLQNYQARMVQIPNEKQSEQSLEEQVKAVSKQLKRQKQIKKIEKSKKNSCQLIQQSQSSEKQIKDSQKSSYTLVSQNEFRPKILHSSNKFSYKNRVINRKRLQITQKEIISEQEQQPIKEWIKGTSNKLLSSKKIKKEKKFWPNLESRFQNQKFILDQFKLKRSQGVSLVFQQPKKSSGFLFSRLLEVKDEIIYKLSHNQGVSLQKHELQQLQLSTYKFILNLKQEKKEWQIKESVINEICESLRAQLLKLTIKEQNLYQQIELKACLQFY